MRVFTLELNNDIKGIGQRKEYIKSLIAKLPSPDLVALPELALCSYMANQQIWQYADERGSDTSAWAMEMAEKYHTFIGVGYLDKENGDYYNRYLIADESKVYGTVTKSEGESAVFKRGFYDSIINTPVVYVNSKGRLEYMPGKMGQMMKTDDVSLILLREML